jgi:uncharacterized membrane protein
MEEIVNTSGTQNTQPESETAQMTDAERWSSLISGSALVLFGLQQRSLRGAIMALAGGGLAYHGATGKKTLQERASEAVDKVSEATGIGKPIRVEKTVTINKPAEELYTFWHNLENLPTFMKHLESVKVIDPRKSHWVAKAPAGQTVEWDADIINDQPNQLIAWASIEGADVDNSGFVRFQPAPGDRGTEVKVVLEYSFPGGAVASALAKLFGEEPEQQIGDELRRFKQLMEAGEIATVEGQTSCRARG